VRVGGKKTTANVKMEMRFKNVLQMKGIKEVSLH
jgi:hypothetical protein